MKTRHGVLTPEGIYETWDTHHAILEVEQLPTTVEGLMYLAISHGFTHLWVPANICLAFTESDIQPLLDTSRWDVGPQGRFISIQKQGKYKGYVTSIVGRALKPRSTNNTRLIFVEQGNWPFVDGTADQILSVAEKIEARLDVAMAGSPTSVGLRYLEKMNKRYYDAYFEKSSNVDWQAMKAEHVPFIAWFPSVQLDTEQEWFLHCFDRNASHPFAASQEDMGVGSPVAQVGGDFNKKYPGLWNVQITGADKLPVNLPPLLPKNDVWLPTPLLRIASIAGCTIKVIEALVWHESAPVFERWAKNLYQFRQEYANGTMERQAFKSIMNNVVGSTRVGEDMDKTLRPDWYATVIGSERAVVWYKAWKLWERYGVAPCGCYADALYYLSTSSNPIDAVPTLLDRRESLGGYKHVWTLPIDDRACKALGAIVGAANRIAELKKLVK